MSDGRKIRIHDLAHDMGSGQDGIAEDRAHRRIRRIPTGGNAHQSIQRSHTCGIEYIPPAIDEYLETGVEVGWVELIGVGGNITRRNIERATQRDRQVGEIPAHSLPILYGIDGRRCLARAAGDIGDIIIDPVTHRRRDIVGSKYVAEHIVRLLTHDVRLAVAAWKQEGDSLGVQFTGRLRVDLVLADYPMGDFQFRLIADIDVPWVDRLHSGESVHPAHDVELLDLQIRVRGQGLAENLLTTRVQTTKGEQKRRRILKLITEIAADFEFHGGSGTEKILPLVSAWMSSENG